MKTGILFSLLLCSLWWVQIFRYVLACRSCSLVCTLHHLIIIIVQAYLKTLNLLNACQIYLVVCVSKIKQFFSVIHCPLCGAVCFQFTHSLVMTEIIYTLAYYHEIGSMNYFSLVRVRSWNNGMSCVSLYIRDMARLLRGTFVFWWYLSRIWPSVTDMQHYYHARYPTDDWHLGYMFSLVCFSVGVCLVGVFPHSIGTRRDPCVRVCAPLKLAFPSLENKNRTGVTRPSTWAKWGGIWTDAWVCHHYWVVIWVAGYSNSPLYCIVNGVCHRQDTLWTYGRILF